jgi:hypothetical protein
MNTTTAQTTHIIHASGRTEMEHKIPGSPDPREARSYTVIECHIREGVLVTYDNVCPSCYQTI